MKIRAILLVFIAGCSPTAMDKAKQDFSCKDNGGVYSYSKISVDAAICNDGSVIYNWKGVRLTKDFYPNAEVK